MGLDWIPGARALPGKEAKFLELVEKIKVCSKKELDKLNDELDTISSFKFDVLKVPIVGRDQAADDYMKELYKENQIEEPFEKWILENNGKYVFDLVEPCDGIPKYSNGGFYDGVDFTSFRANFLKDCVEIIGKDLLDQAFTIMTAAELINYSNALEKKALEFAHRKNIDVSEIDWDAEDKEEPLEHLDIVMCAARYCRFWGSHGYYIHAWF